MDRRRALLNAMRSAGAPPRGGRAVERLVGPEHRRLRRLLAAAAGPARPHELTGEQAVLDAYVRAGQDPRPARALLVRLRRALLMKVTAVFATVLVGSAAFAAQTGHLPSGAQQTAHDLFSSWGVPAPRDAGPAQGGGPPGGPAASPRPDGPGAGGPGPGRAGAGPPPRSPSVTRPPAGGAPDVRELCRTFLERYRNPGSAPLDAASLRRLAAAANGEANIRAYCAQIPQTAAPPTRGATPTSPRGRDPERQPPPRESPPPRR